MIWFESFKSSCPQIFFKIGIFKNVAIFTEKYSCQNLFLRLRETHKKCLCSSSPSSRFSASRVRNIGARYIRDFGPCHNVKNQVCCYTTPSSRQKTDSGISKNNSSVRPGLLLEKNCGSGKVIQTFHFIVINN